MKRPTKREIVLGLARLAGYHNESNAFYRIHVEQQLVSYANLLAAWRAGVQQREAGVRCGCYECNSVKAVSA